MKRATIAISSPEERLLADSLLKSFTKLGPIKTLPKLPAELFPISGSPEPRKVQTPEVAKAPPKKQESSVQTKTKKTVEVTVPSPAVSPLTLDELPPLRTTLRTEKPKPPTTLSGKMYSIDDFSRKFNIPMQEVNEILDGSRVLPPGIATISTGTGWNLWVDSTFQPRQPAATSEIEKAVDKNIRNFFDVIKKGPILEIPVLPNTPPVATVESQPIEAESITKPEKLKLLPITARQLVDLHKQNYTMQWLCDFFGITEEECKWHLADILKLKRKEELISVKSEALQSAAPVNESNPVQKGMWIDDKFVPMDDKEMRRTRRRLAKEAVEKSTQQAEISGPVPYAEPEEEEQEKVKPKAFLSIESLRERFRKKCKKNGKHWLWMGMTVHNKPTFSIDGKAYSFFVASYMLYKTETAQPAYVPEGYSVIRTCNKYNCASPECIGIVPESVARRRTHITSFDIGEVKRLRERGLTYKEIAEVMQSEAVTPRQANRIDNGWLGAHLKQEKSG